MKIFASKNAQNKIKKVKRKNISTLCRYFSLIYPKEYVEGIVGGNCPQK